MFYKKKNDENEFSHKVVSIKLPKREILNKLPLDKEVKNEIIVPKLTQKDYDKMNSYWSYGLDDKGMPKYAKDISDAEGLQRAYKEDKKLYINQNELFVAGTSSLHDWYDDLKLPFGLTSQTQRYIDAAAALEANPEVDTLSGHSLGAAVALELQKNYPDRNLKITTYGSPSFSVLPEGGNVNRFANYFDPVAMFDLNANRSFNIFNPHSYLNFDNTSGNVVEASGETKLQLFDNDNDNPDGRFLIS
jgi:hypothetical protein